MSAITRFLPRKTLSQFIGKLVHFQGPKWWAHFSISVFAKYYRIDLNEAEKPISSYLSIGDFFVRKLKPGLRPKGQAWALHPADAVISQSGVIHDDSLVQAKSLTYKLDSLTGDPAASVKWNDGYFLTYYLCPTDYHRVHSPVSGRIIKARLLRGDLWPVNEWSTSNIVNLFGINERVLVEIETDLGPVAVILVGATNVGSIELSFTDQIRGNSSKSSEEFIPSDAMSIQAGDELGMFRMGSTVVMLYPPKAKQLFLDKGLSSQAATRVCANLIRP